MMTPLDSRVLDANSEALGTSVGTLMDNAGRAVAGLLAERYLGKRIIFVCGPGNNGGDGFTAALRMDQDTVKVALLKKPSAIHSDISRERYSVLECPIEAYEKASMDGYDVIVDCALGTGVSGEVREPYRSFICDANSSGKPVVSVDVPSGLGTGLSVKADVTITFHDVKTGMDESQCGEIVVADIGIPEEASSVVGPGDMLRYPIPKKDSHKGLNGRLMVIGGGPYFGAPILSSLSALRTGTDSVRVFTPFSASTIISNANPVLMVTPLPGNHLCPESVDMLLKSSKSFDAVLIGPGLGTDPGTMEAVRSFVSGCGIPMVVDADGLTAIKGMRLNGNAVLTPHRREFRDLNPEGMDQQALARSLNATILLKGAEDSISDGVRTRINRTGTPAMTGAGTGDVLAGCVAGLLSKGMSAFDAASLGAFMCGKAGEYAFKDKSYGLIATDVVEELPHVLRDLL